MKECIMHWLAHHLSTTILKHTMPEGPSLVILKEALQPFEGKKILAATGNSKIEKAGFVNKKVNFRTFGKQLLICLPATTYRVHLLMFGSYSIDEQTKPDRSLRLCLRFKTGTVYFYTCSVKLIETALEAAFDWPADVLSDQWSPAKAIKKLKAIPGAKVCDALLDQDIFAGVGNIIKNEVLYRIKIHPESLIGKLPPKQLALLVKEARNYSFDFLKWKKAFELKKHWLAHTKKSCLRCDLPLIKTYPGKTKRRAFFCTNCQVLFD